jgi:hypothetical protein
MGFSLEPAPPDADPDPGEGLSACRSEVALSPVSFVSPTAGFMLRNGLGNASEKDASGCGYAVYHRPLQLWKTGEQSVSKHRNKPIQ